MFGVPHRVVHDLESLFFVLLFICTHLDGPHISIGHPPLYGPDSKDHASPMKHWLSLNNFSILGHMKHSQMSSCHFETVILPHISPYFKPLKPHLLAFWHALYPRGPSTLPAGMSDSHSLATCQSIINVLKLALQDNALYPPKGSLAKRSLPGDLVSTSGGWDTAPVKKKSSRGKPKVDNIKTSKRKSSLMTKLTEKARRRGGLVH